jgi:tRNA-specific 2-thiouridylase
MRDSLIAEQLHWTRDAAPAISFSCQARCRHRQSLQDCTVVIEDGLARVSFTDPQRAITPGQSIVFYQEDECLGGGIIQ